MLPSEQEHRSLATSPTFGGTRTTATPPIIVEMIDDDSTFPLPVHQSPNRRIMAHQPWAERRDPSETSQATLSSCCSGSTAATAAADDASSSIVLPPLHQALRDYAIDALLAGSRADLERDILQLITVDTACVYDETGHLPLHIACRAGLPLAVVERLVAVYPEAVRLPTRNPRQLLPLHILCQYYAGTTNRERTKLLAFVLRSYPAAARIATVRDGELPLHLLCHNYFCSVANLALVLKYHPDAILTPTKNRHNLPIHIACGKKYMVREVIVRPPSKNKRGGNAMIEDEPGSSSDEIIHFLAQKCRHSLTMVNGKGELPFHAAVRGYQSLDTLRLLLQVHPPALTATDVHGRTPLHLAVSRPEPCRVTLRALLETETTARTVVDRDGKTPVDYANHHSEPWVRELFAQHSGTTTTTTQPTPAATRPYAHAAAAAAVQTL